MTLTTATVPALLDEIQALWPSTDASSQLPNLRNPYALVAAAVFSGTNRPDLVPAVWSHAVTEISSTDEKALVARRLRDAIFKAGLLTGYSRAINALISLNTDLPEEYRAAKFGSERGLDWPTGSGGTAGNIATTGVTSATETELGTSAQDVLRPPASLGDFVAAEPVEGSAAESQTAIGAAAVDARARLVPGAPHPTLDQIANNGLAYFNELYGTTAEMVQSTLDGIYPDMGEWDVQLLHSIPRADRNHSLHDRLL